jgi:hypothetical protein
LKRTGNCGYLWQSDITLPNELTLNGEIIGKPADFKPVSLGWKDEGDVGKVWVEDANGDCASAAQWITRGAARKLAKKMGLPFEEY